MASANLMAISMNVRPISRPNTENRNSNSVMSRPALRPQGLSEFLGKEKVEADDPARNRCGCFLPDLTRLATAPSADFRACIWGKPRTRARLSIFIARSRGAVYVMRTHARALPPRHAPRRRPRASLAFDPDHRHRASLGAVHQLDGRGVPRTQRQRGHACQLVLPAGSQPARDSNPGR